MRSEKELRQENMFGIVEPGVARQLFANLITHTPIPKLYDNIDAMNAKPGQLGHILGYSLAANPYGDGLYRIILNSEITLEQKIQWTINDGVEIDCGCLSATWSEGAWPQKRGSGRIDRLVKLFQLDNHLQYVGEKNKRWRPLQTVEEKETHLRSEDMGFRSLTFWEFLGLVYGYHRRLRVPVVTIGSWVVKDEYRWYPLFTPGHCECPDSYLTFVRESAIPKNCFYAVTPVGPEKPVKSS